MSLGMHGKRPDETPQSLPLILQPVYLLDKGMKHLTLLLDDGASQIVLCGEMVVNGGGAHLKCFSQIIVAKGIEALRSKELLSEVEDAITCCHAAIY